MCPNINLNLNSDIHNAWFVGYVQCFIKHSQNGVASFLAVIETMKKHELDEFGVPVVMSNSRGQESQKIAVCDVTDIVEGVGLVRFSSTQNKYKVIWPYPCYYKKLDHKLAGKLNDL